MTAMPDRGRRRSEPDDARPASATLPRHPLPPVRRMTGRERRWVNPNRGFVKLLERRIDRLFSRYVYPHLLGIWSPYSWQLPRRLCITEGSVAPTPWPAKMSPLRVLLLSDLHVGPFLLPETLAPLLRGLMELKPDLVVIAGDLISGRAHDLEGFLSGLEELTRAPLGAWFCLGNHEYFSPDPFYVVDQLRGIGVHTLRNHAVRLIHCGQGFVFGGLDDIVLGVPDWDRMLAAAGPPHLLMVHNPDAFYEAAKRGIGLVLSGHTHAGQIRIPGGPPLVRQSRYCLDEGIMSFGTSVLVVSRGVGASGLPWRFGARPEALLLTVRSAG